MIGEPFNFDLSVTEYELDSGNHVSIEHMSPRTTNVPYAVAVLSEEDELTGRYRGWPEFIGNHILMKDSRLWMGGSHGGLEMRQWGTSLMQELLLGRQYNVAVHPPADDGDGTDSSMEDTMSTSYPYGTNNYWTESNLVPPELASSTDPALTTADLADFQYIHSQITPSATWVVQHDLGRKPIVSVVDSNGALMVAEVTHVDNDTLHLVFQTDQAGTARCV